VPTRLLEPDTSLLRSVAHERAPLVTTPAGSPKGFISAEQERQGRTPRDVLDARTNNRWTGWGPGGHVAGLYLSLSSGALAAELAHYQHGKVAEAFTQGRQTLLSYRVLGSLLLVDLSKHCLQADRVFELLGKDADVRAELMKAGMPGRPLKELAFSTTDYSVARGIGIGLAMAKEPSFDGLIVHTARGDERTGFDGDNVVLFGKAGEPHSALWLECIIHLTSSGTVDEINRVTVRP
jgi:hypothetical protein